VPTDSDVRYGYPNTLNVCYANLAGWSKFRPIDLSHQRQFCTTSGYCACPIYVRRVADARRNGRHTRTQTYFQFFGLEEEPFSIVPQPRFLVQSEGQQQAYDRLRWLLDQHQGLGLLFGPVGTGKTLLCRTLTEELGSEPQYVTALLLTPSFRSEYALMADVLAAWKITSGRRRSLRDLEMTAHDFLIQSVLDRQQTVLLIIDEAQSLSTRCMQQVCKLLNWQDGGQQLLQVILAGQPNLHNKLNRVPALHDRAVVEVTLGEMTLSDSQKMITTRLRRAGRRGDLFAPSAIQAIHHHAAGIPRRITILCQLSMWLAYQEGVRYISGDVAQAVIEQVRGKNVFAMPEGTAAQVTASLSLSEARPAHAPLPRLLHWFRALITT
jgi:general secretion pathway protein A